MPSMDMRIDPKYGGRKSVARGYLQTPGTWDELPQEEKDAWNRATAAISDLLDIYHAKELAK